MKNEISYGLFTKGHVSNVSFKEFKNSDGEAIAIGWFGDHQYRFSFKKGSHRWPENAKREYTSR